MLPFELTKDTPYLALSGELWSVFYEYFTETDRVIKGFYCSHIVHKNAFDLYDLQTVSICANNKWMLTNWHTLFNGLVSDCSNTIANTLELLWSALSHWYDHYTVETLYKTVNFCWNTHKRHSIARPKGRGMGCLLWVQRATYCVDLSKLSSIKYLL